MSTNIENHVQVPQNVAVPQDDAFPQVTAGHSGQGCSCGSDHDHGPTGADVVKSLGQGFAVLSIAVPILALVLLGVGLAFTPSTPLVAVLGLALGLAQVAVLVGLGLLAARNSRIDANSPAFLAGRVALEEVLRLIVTLAALSLLVFDLRGPLGLWIGTGAMLVWAALSTVQLVASRRRILKPGEWSKATVLSVLDEKISTKRAMTLRFLDIAAVMIFQLGASVLVAASPIMVAATAVLSAASGFSTLIVQRRKAAERQRTAWVYVPFAIAVLTLALALGLILIPGL